MSEARLGAFVAPDLPSLEGIRACVHCGICLPQCPTYRVLGEEMDSPRGRIYLIRAVAEGRLEPSETFSRHLDLCLGCRACETACPAGVPFGSLLEATRTQLRRRHLSSQQGLVPHLIFALFPHPRLLGIMLRLYERSGLGRMLRAGGLLQRFPRLAAMEALLPPLPAAEPLPEFTPAEGRRRGRVGLLTGCVQRHLYPGVHRDTVRLLSAAGYEVVVPPQQGCCGALELHGGWLRAFRARARALARAFEGELLDAIVTNSAGCGSAMKEYDHWLPDDPQVTAFAGRVKDVSELLVDAVLPLGRLEATVTYHDACHLAHGQRIRQEPRALLGRIPGLRLVPLADSDLCCGSAGVYNLLEPEMADRLLDMKLARIAETGAHIVAAGNPGCLLQIAKGARARGMDLEVVHPVELLARAIKNEDT